MKAICPRLDHIAQNAEVHRQFLCICALHCHPLVPMHGTVRNNRAHRGHSQKHAQPPFGTNERLHIRIFGTRPLFLNIANLLKEYIISETFSNWMNSATGTTNITFEIHQMDKAQNGRRLKFRITIDCQNICIFGLNYKNKIGFKNHAKTCNWRSSTLKCESTIRWPSK